MWCSPPEELVLPKEFPRVRIPFLAALLSPIAWQVGRPDLFDSYSAGVLLLQMAGQLAVLGDYHARDLCSDAAETCAAKVPD